MRMLVYAKIPHETFNAAVRDGSAGQKLNRILEATKPEAVYFTEVEGHRGAIMIVNLEDPSKVPMLAEPWFLTFNADVEFRVAMTPEDLARAGLDALGKKWASGTGNAFAPSSGGICCASTPATSRTSSPYRCRGWWVRGSRRRISSIRSRSPVLSCSFSPACGRSTTPITTRSAFLVRT